VIAGKQERRTHSRPKAPQKALQIGKTKIEREPGGFPQY